MRRSLALLALLAVLFVGLPGWRASAQSAPESMKAAFVFNVLNFVEWPGSGPANAPLRVAVIAPKPQAAFGAALQGRTVRGRTIAVQTYDSIESLEQADVVLLTTESSSQLKGLLKKLGSEPVLSIAEQGLDAPVQTTMALGVVDARLAFAVNLDVADAASLQFNPNLLKLAKSVKSGRARTK